MLFPDLPRALAEMVRVTKPGGRVLMIVVRPADADRLPWLLSRAPSSRSCPGFPGLPDEPPPLEFQVADPERLRERLDEAGLHDVRIEALGGASRRSRPGRQLWDWVLNSNPIAGHVVADLHDEQRADVRRALDGMVRERAGTGDEAVLSGPVNIGIGTK